MQHIFDSVKHSLERLQLDYIDVLQCEFLLLLSFSVDANLHRPSIRQGYSYRRDGGQYDILWTVELVIDMWSQMQALNDVVKAGYVRYIGMSSCYAWQCEKHRLSTYAGTNPILRFSPRNAK